jgi:hypothetical protein
MAKRASKGKARKTVGGRKPGGKRGARAGPKVRADADKAQSAKGRSRAAPMAKNRRLTPAIIAVTKRAPPQKGKAKRGIRLKPGDEILVTAYAPAPSQSTLEVVGVERIDPGVGATSPEPPEAEAAADLPGHDDTPIE